MMKKIVLITLNLLLYIFAIAQLPAGHDIIFEFTDGSNANTSIGSSVPALSNSFTSINDRNNSAGDAAELNNSIFTPTNAIMPNNTLNTTLSFWTRTDVLAFSRRVFQMYGSSGNGYRIELDGSNFRLNTQAESNSANSELFTIPINLDDNNWHHIAVTTQANASQDTITFEIYIDNVLQNSSNGYKLATTTSNPITDFMISPNLVFAPGGQYDGDVDDIYFYTSTLNTTEVSQLFNYYPGGNLDTLYIDADATGNNDGSSWANAYTNARDAFINASPKCVIGIAEGTYIRNSTDRNAVFGWLVDSIMVYGGFAGGETSRDQRDWNANPTIFSGDIGVVGDSTDNAYTVFTGPVGDQTYSLIDGIKITGGNADANSYPDFNSVGGGMALDTDVDFIEIKNVEFYNNYALQGGAISVYGFSGDALKVKLENVVAHNNTGRSSAFGHFRGLNNTSIELEMINCLIYENNALNSLAGQTQDFGTVMFLGANGGPANNLIANITNCTLANNSFVTNHQSSGMIRVYRAGSSNSSLAFTNNICYGNGIEEITDKNSAGINAAPFPIMNFNNNILENGLDFASTAENNTLTSNPLFNTDYSLQLGSPAIDAGTASGVILPLFDIEGNSRVFGSAVDLGAFEFSCTTPLVVLTLNNGNITASGASIYSWYLDGVDLNLSNTTVYTPTQDGEYYVVGMSVDGCIDTSNFVNYCGSFTLTIAQNGNVLTADAVFSNYQWFLDGAAIAGANTETFTASQSGNYTCEAENNGCIGTSNTIFIDLGTSIRNTDFESLKVYPNPTTGTVNLEISEELSSIRLMDLTGKTIKDFNAESRQLDISAFTSGIYFLEIANTEKKSLIKIFKK